MSDSEPEADSERRWAIHIVRNISDAAELKYTESLSDALKMIKAEFDKPEVTCVTVWPEDHYAASTTLSTPN